jgi:hypothetical protein
MRRYCQALVCLVQRQQPRHLGIGAVCSRVEITRKAAGKVLGMSAKVLIRLDKGSLKELGIVWRAGL